jgi:hypothetical protein
LAILWQSPTRERAKFGYRWKKATEKKIEHPLCLATFKNLLSKYGRRQIFFPQNVANFPHYFPQKSFGPCRPEFIFIIFVAAVKNFAKKTPPPK